MDCVGKVKINRILHCIGVVRSSIDPRNLEGTNPMVKFQFVVQRCCDSSFEHNSINILIVSLTDSE